VGLGSEVLPNGDTMNSTIFNGFPFNSTYLGGGYLIEVLCALLDSWKVTRATLNGGTGEALIFSFLWEWL
jgi:hypothetical protein